MITKMLRNLDSILQINLEHLGGVDCKTFRLGGGTENYLDSASSVEICRFR